ncbi:CU044_5270 family protein [Streptomyces sp. YU58]|uniref:CU044_5270 family protein n=1 Tax=Streptomyces sp. SX92 TaxID=3158972 RepID=UPI0027B9918D|nr:CU044_5270 family protein [Streptomyces coralus]WLW53049.1 CU044_5270 family protein [Streptomyces coralus]
MNPQLPEVPERDLPPGRHRLLKEHLMTEIRRGTTEAEAVTVAASESVRTRRKWLSPALAAGAVTAVTAVVLTVAVPSERSSSEPPASKAAVTLWEDIALAAEHSDVPKGIRDDQYVYINSKVGWSSQSEGEPAKLEPIRRREVWLSVDGTRDGLAREGDAGSVDEPLDKPTPGIPSNTDYRHLQTLPTDPDKMFTWLNSVSEGSSSKDEANFVLVGDLLRESLMPPAQAAALYRAAARISGVFVVDDTVDAAGRHGVAVARIDDGERHELIFDKRTKEFLGEREVAVEDLSWGFKKGQVTARTAILERAVVDRPGQRP